MEKIRFRNTLPSGWDGATAVVTAPNFSFVGGFWEAQLPDPAGRMPAGLFGKAPGADAYVLHATMYSRVNPQATDYLAVKTPQGNYRRLWTPFPGNTRAALVRPDDELEFKYVVNAGNACVLELLIEPLAAANEFGPILLDLLREEARENLYNPTAIGDVIASATTSVPLFSGALRYTCTNGAAINLNLPDVSALRLEHLLMVTTAGAGAVNLVPFGGQTINKAAGNYTITATNKSAWLRGYGTDWSLVFT